MPRKQIFKKVAVKSSHLEQGDLVLGLTIPVTRVTDVSNLLSMKSSIELEWSTGNFVILTQSCDLDPNNDKQIDRIILAPVLTLGDFLRDNPYYRKTDRFHRIIKNKTQNFYCVPPPEDSILDTGELIIIVLDSLNVVQLDLLKRLVSQRNSSVLRYRMLSPYSEDLSNNFAYQFERVPLPDRIFPPEDLQRASIQKLAHLRASNFDDA